MAAKPLAETTVLSLFSGAGGMDLGLAAAGWSIAAQVEMDYDCSQTLEQHRFAKGARATVINSRIEDIDPRRLRLQLGLSRGALGLIAGGPPCQPFTTHGLRQAIRDPRVTSAFPHYLRFVQEFRPHILLMENVDGLLSAALRHRPLVQRGSQAPAMVWEERKGSFLHWLLSDLAGMGYAVTWGLLEAADHGVAQFRQRAFLIGTRDGDPCFLPAASYGWGEQPAYRTLRHAIGKLQDPGPIQPLSATKRDVYSLVPAGGNWRDLPEAVRRRTMGRAYLATGGKGGWWRRLSWNEPSPTILGMPDHSSTGLIHPDAVRCLGLFECAAIQSFARRIRFAGKPRSQYQQVGNAVPPLLARRVGTKLLRHLEGKREHAPAPPPWRQRSANRRIGTHGWVIPTSDGPTFQLIVKPREDHVWAMADRGGEVRLGG